MTHSWLSCGTVTLGRTYSASILLLIVTLGGCSAINWDNRKEREVWQADCWTARLVVKENGQRNIIYVTRKLGKC